MSIGIYDAKQVSVTINNGYLTGFGENTFVSCEKDEEQTVAHVGARGEVAIAHKNNPLGTIKLTLMSTSPQLPLLYRLAREKKLFQIWVKSNNQPNETIGGTQAVVKKVPAATYGSELEDREFEIQVLDYTHRTE
ncbi:MULTISPECIES: phage structural protein [Paenibacillus]|uniref:DUF3277 domain-containing protein n=1 Tax=Paenibacillus alvei TaxID=44250 RepID=A0AAP7DH65_PAEAL|nr:MULTISPECIES: phage protein [Paenibacillus]MBG9737685.1 hypothetical protein [Paenibacillus alvei]MBG9747378.1 hypothetical protein [Paenibacillus alvei]MCY7487848.1 DUF3277 family protein [Paenibacillus alvei]MCY9581117.1 DUF3277 family protein [Paenibacillus alvei]MCY9584592.1 DUF3277 family protein [Paenibacillus alvei]